jgi:hypothetical protein
MPNYTERFQLEKPLQSEHYNVSVPNANMDLIDQIMLGYGVASGVNNYTLTMQNYVLQEGRAIRVKFENANTISTPTLDINSVGPRQIVSVGGGNPGVGSIKSGGIYDLIYTGAQFQASGALESASIPLAQKGAANGVATLDSNSKVPAGQLRMGTAGGLATLDTAGQVLAAQIPPLGYAPTSHAVSTTTYGVASAGLYGHVQVMEGNGLSLSGGVVAMAASTTGQKGAVQLSNDTASADQTKAVTPYALKQVKDLIASSGTSTVPTNHASSATTAQGAKADSAIQGVKVNGAALTPDGDKVVTIPPIYVKEADIIGPNANSRVSFAFEAFAYEDVSENSNIILIDAPGDSVPGRLVFVKISNTNTSPFVILKTQVDQSTPQPDLSSANVKQLGYTEVAAGALLAGRFYAFRYYANDYWYFTAEIEPSYDDPTASGTAAIGSSLAYAREDHVHPAQTVPIQTVKFRGVALTPDADKAVNVLAATTAQGVKADSAIQGVKLNGTPVTPDASKIVNLSITSDPSYATSALADMGLIPPAGYLETASETGENVYVLGPFRHVFYRTGDDAVASADTDDSGVPDYIEDMALQYLVAYHIYTSVIGIRSPFLSPRFADKNYQYIRVRYTTENGNGSLAYRVIQTDSNGIGYGPIAQAIRPTFYGGTPAHETFHMFQYGFTPFGNNWYLEGMARWMEDVVYTIPYVVKPREELLSMLRIPAKWNALIALSYTASEHFWRPLGHCFESETQVILNPNDPFLRLRYRDGSPALHEDWDLSGVRFLPLFLSRLEAESERCYAEQGYTTWTSAEYGNAVNNKYIRWVVEDLLTRL